MQKKILVSAIVIAGLLFCGCTSNSSIDNVKQNITVITSPSEGYIHFLNDSVSKYYLVNSNINYSTYDRDIGISTMTNYAKIGDPCLIVNGTIRNDDNKTYWVPITAKIYNKNGESVGIVITDSAHPSTQAKYIGIVNNSTGSFSILIKYDKQDVSSYEIFISREPVDIPPP